MSSFMKMFKSKKTSSNKENDPLNRSAYERASSRSAVGESKDRLSDFIVFRGQDGQRRPHEVHVPNPYSVVTEPKTTRGPRSCPGAPITSLDRHSNGGTYERSKQRHLDTSMRVGSVRDNSLMQQSFDRRSMREFCTEREPKRGVNRRVQDRYLSDFAESDEENEQRIRELEIKYSRMKKKLQEENRELQFHLNEAIEEREYYKSHFNRASKAYSQAKRTIELEKAHVQRVRKELLKANARVAELEERLADSGNDSSLLMCSYSIPSEENNGNSVELSLGGAGEALCSLSEQKNEAITSIHSQSTIGMKHDVEDEQDEVRVFRSEEGDCTTPPPERPRRDVNDHFATLSITSRDSEQLTSSELRKVSSDSDLGRVVRVGLDPRSVRVRVHEEENRDWRADPTAEQVYYNTSMFRRQKRGNEPYFQGYGDDTTSASSDDDRVALIERQLRRRGEVVKFQPPRSQVQQKHFKRYGRLERTALAEFEYLQDLSTDVSGMLSSPDTMQLR